MNDYLVRGIVDAHNCRVFAIRSTDLTNVAREKHDLWPCASAALGRVMAVTLMMGAMNKSGDKITVNINGHGPIGTVLATTHSDGTIKAFVSNPHVHYVNEVTRKLDVGRCVGIDGSLQVIRDMGLKEPVTSSVPLQTGEIGDDFAYYFVISEQIPSAISVGVLADETGVKAAGGFIIQLLPGATEEDILYIEDALKDIPSASSMIDQGDTPESMLARIFGDEVTILDRQDVCFACDCSKEHMAAALMTVSDEELETMAREDHGCEITCHFCNTHYYFDENDLRQIIAQKQAR